MYYKNKSITIETTNRCSAKCVMCPREKMIQPLEVMSQNLFEKIVRDAFKENIKTIDLCGYGDVLLDKGLIEKIKFAKELNPNCSIYVSTTGNAMHQKFFDAIVKYVDIVKYSIYALTKELYEEVMGGIKFEKSMRNIEDLSKFDNNKKVYTIGNFIKLDENKQKIFGLERINLHEKVYIVEGPLDSLFLPNSLAAAGSDLDLRIRPENQVYIFDNEPRNKEIVARMYKCIDSNNNIVICPNDVREKILMKWLYQVRILPKYEIL